MTIEKANKDMQAFIKANCFTENGERTSTGETIYSRAWARKVQVVWYGEREQSFEIEVWISCGIPMVRIKRNGRPDARIRDYSSPRRAFNAIREIVRIEGYDF